jgi:Domain of unknown function (DUF4126)
MDALVKHLPDLALAAALAWGAGIRLYLVVFGFGAANAFGGLPLPEHLHVIAHPAVMASSGFMAFVELFADKLPWLDSLWDAIHTFVRIPAGAALAAAVFGDSSTAIAVAAALLGGTLTATTHFAKSGTRAAANASPEPFTNVALSLAEDGLVVGGTWLATTYPAVFLIALAIFLVAAVMILHLIWKGFRRIFPKERADNPMA